MPGPRHAFILDAPRDLLLLVATPVLILPLLALVRGSVSDTAIAAAVLAFGATGHHLPGLLRAYGDRDLFERFRMRFVFGPVLLFLVCFFFYTFRFEGMVAMVTLWGTWHALAQVYGFGRIYDAKVGAFDARTAQLDKALCIAWFVLPMLVSPWRIQGLLEDAYASGLPVIAAETLTAAGRAWMAGTALVTLLWVANFVRRWARGEPGNPIKAALFASSIGFWVYAIATARHELVGLAMFEIFHDIQYLTIVWLYNRKRTEQPGADLSRALRFLFRPGIALVGLYLVGVFAYGGLDFLRQRVPTGELTNILSGVFAMSAFLHYYYDSFIWNLRDESTRSGLSVEASVSPQERVAAWLPQIRNWAWFGVPLALLVGGQVLAPRPPVDRREALVVSLPESAASWIALGEAQHAFGRSEESIASLRRGLAIDARRPLGWAVLADAAMASERPPLEREALEQLIALEPDAVAPRLRLALHFERSGDRARARAELDAARRIDPAGTAELLPSFRGRGGSPYRPPGS